jgi:hypothetical protein
MKKRLRFSKKNLNIWFETNEGDLKLIKIPMKLKEQFISIFPPANGLPKEDEISIWLSLISVGNAYTIDI